MLIGSFVIMLLKMNAKQVEAVFQSKAFKYGLRVLVLLIFSIVFKSFDLSFHEDAGSFFFRREGFSLLFLLIGLLTWVGAVQLSKYIERNVYNNNLSYKLLLMCSSLIVYGVLASCLFGFSYSVFDIFLYKNYEAWKSFSSLSYDLYFGAFIFYLLILAYSGIIFYYKSWKESQLNAERLMRENIQSKYDALKNQIDPHFFFNSLSVLTNLVYKSPDLSAEYITQLAKSYRYILDKKFENLVSVNVELEFLESYLFLMRIRHQDSIVFNIDIDEQTRCTGLLPPATLQMLVENAVKHNRFSANDPLHIDIKSVGTALTVSNKLRKRLVLSGSTGVGLENIRKRYELTSDKRIEITETTVRFTVKVPIIKNDEDYHI